MRTIIPLLLFSSLLAFASCQPKKVGSPATTSSDTAFIPVDTANVMIQSYLNSIAYHTNDSSLRSLIVDADALRTYLTEGEGTKITQMKIVFGHTLSYINAGHADQPCGYNSGELTVILAGFDSKGNYIYSDGCVLDHVQPCPHQCPVSGTASNDLLPD